MTVLLDNDSRVAGTVKFNASVPIEKLVGFITHIKADNTERWFDLHIRGAGDDGTHYIAFHYILPDGKKKTQTKMVNKLLQYLRDELGTHPKKGKNPALIPRGVIGWSIGTVKVVA
ncbi:hypothetical protein K2X96_00080 [Patescibacteria group bacterium]|nr:hypothetical protein [Patescibacteria group bacterium]